MDEFKDFNTDTLLREFDELMAQAGIFEMDVDGETASLVPHSTIGEKPYALGRWIENNSDKQMDHEFMNRDGDR